MWLMLQQDKADKFVIGTGETHEVKQFLDEVFTYVGLRWQDHIKIDQKYMKPTEVNVLQAGISKAKKELNWSPRIGFKDLVKIMVDSDLIQRGINPLGEGK